MGRGRRRPWGEGSLVPWREGGGSLGREELPVSGAGELGIWGDEGEDATEGVEVARRAGDL